MVQWRLYITPGGNKRYMLPKDSTKDMKLIEHTCVLTGEKFKSRGKFWKYIEESKIDPDTMTYDKKATYENTELMDKSHLEWLWIHYFEEKGNKKKLENLIGSINLELYIILLKVYKGDMDIDECLNDNVEESVEEEAVEEKEIEESSKEGCKFIMDGITIINGDCMEEMKHIELNSVNAIITDLPYGVSKNNWDTPLDLDKMWELFKKIVCKDGIIILTASGKFTARLMMSNIDMFKYDIIWEKTVNSGQLNVNKMPLRSHENILIFYNKNRTYNEQKTIGEPYKIKRKDTTGDGYGGQTGSEKTNDGFRHARSVIKISNPRKKGGHPTQKPVELMEYLIKAYTNEGDVVLDCCMGGGSTGIAAVKNNRKFIGIEMEKKYYDVAVKDIIDQTH